MSNLKRISTMKALVLLGMALIMILTLPGCAGFGLSPAEPITIKFAYLENAADYQPLADAFHKKNPNITIELDVVKFTGGNPDDMLRMKADEVDAVRIASTAVDDQWIQKFIPLDTYITTDKGFPQDDLFSGSLEGLKMGGKQVGLPAALNPYVIFYDPLRFKAWGVNPPGAGWTLDDFMKTAMAMNNTDETLRGTMKYGYGFCSSPQFSDPIMFAFIYGGNIFNNIGAPTAPTLNNPANIAALTWYGSLRNEFGIMPPSDQPRQVGELIVRGSCGFWMDWLDRSQMGRWMQNQKLAALPLPSYTGVAPFSISTLDLYSIMAKSTHPDETWKWLRFLLDQPTAAGSLVPPRRSQVSDELFKNKAAADVVGVASSMPSQGIVLGLEMYRDPRLAKVVELYAQAATKVLSGDTTAQMALDEAQHEAEASFGN